MARIDTLTNFLTDVANAIRSKKGTTDTISPANFDTEIESIETGGGSSGDTWEYEMKKMIERTDTTSIQIPSNVTKIGYYAFRQFDFTSINIPSTVTIIDERAFYNCSKLTTLDLPKSLVTIQSYAFSDCYNVAIISLPETLTTLNSNAFSSCYSVTISRIPAGIKEITNYVFQQCQSIPYMIIEGDINYVGTKAFYNCTNLQYVDLSKCTTVPQLANKNAFPTTTQIIVPDDLYDAWIEATNWVSIASQIVKKSDWEASQNA